MNAAERLLLTTFAIALLVASCGQRGPLTLPEQEAGSDSALLTQG